MEKLYVMAASAEAYTAGETPVDIKSLLQQRCHCKPRRTSRLTDLSLLGALQCARQLELQQATTGLYLGSGRGNVGDTVDILQQILVQDVAPMPLSFINVSNNMAGYYVAQQLALSGRSLAVTSGSASFDHALELALMDLECGVVEYALVGAVEEAATPLADYQAALGLESTQALAESSAWMMVGREAGPEPLAEIRFCRHLPRLEQLLELIETIPSRGRYVAASELPDKLTVLLAEHGIGALEGDLPGYNQSIMAWRLLQELKLRECESLLFLRGDVQQGFFLLWLEVVSAP